MAQPLTEENINYTYDRARSAANACESLPLASRMTISKDCTGKARAGMGNRPGHGLVRWTTAAPGTRCLGSLCRADRHPVLEGLSNHSQGRAA